jgi:alginate production protein
MLIMGILLTVTPLMTAMAIALSNPPDWLEIEGQLEIETTREQNFDLLPLQSETLHIVRPELQIGTWIKPWPGLESFILLELAHAFDLRDDTGNDELAHAEFVVKEASITVRGQALLEIPLSIQVGRQAFEDERQWLYDDELDAIRVVFQFSRFHLEATVARVALVDVDVVHGHDTDHTDFYHLYAQYTFGPLLTFAAYGLVQMDNESPGERPAFLGFRASGVFEPGLHYWLDVAHVRGKSEEQRLRGWGADIQVLYAFDLVAQPLLIFGYAFGSGDDTPENATNTTFRQTGLQGNGAPYGSVTDIQYYGELLDPELSNLHIFTVGLGLWPLEDASVTVLYHLYRQHARSDELREVAINAEPTGLSRDIGSEVDVIGGWDLEPFELKLIFGVFFPGSAFESETNNAFFSQLRQTIEF